MRRYLGKLNEYFKADEKLITAELLSLSLYESRSTAHTAG